MTKEMKYHIFEKKATLKYNEVKEKDKKEAV